MARSFNLTDVLTRAEDRALAWADAIGRTAEVFHRTAPRGGENTNRYGQPRSAPGEQPATEEGDLLALIEVGVQPIPGGGSAIVNYTALEDGTEHVQPRPLGRITIESIKAHAQSGGQPDTV